MSLKDKLAQVQKDETKKRNRFKVNVIRGLRSELQNAEIEKQSSLTPEEELEILQREIKRRKESLADYERSGRKDLLEQLKEEVAILEEYLPQQLSEEELKEIVRQAIEETGAISTKDTGKVMGKVMPQVKGKADGNQVKAIVEEMLS